MRLAVFIALAGFAMGSVVSPRSAADQPVPVLPGDFVGRLPEVVEKVAPEYPPDAACAGLQGTVLVQVLVGKGGLVEATRVVKSISGLDDAAVACVLQWKFKPAMSNDQPVRVWVAVPVRFPPDRLEPDSAELEVLPQPASMNDDSITPPKIIFRTAPLRPKGMMHAAQSDTVVVAALVGKRCGAAKSVRILKSVPGLDEAAEDCVRHWSFAPAVVRGSPRAVWIRTRVIFPPESRAAH